MLRAVKAEFIRGHHKYICLAAKNSQELSYKDMLYFTKFIQNRLGGDEGISVVQWLRWNGVPNIFTYSLSEHRKYRIRWLDNMIEEFS